MKLRAPMTFGAAMLGMVCGCTPVPEEAPADLILNGATIYAAEGWAQSLAVRDGIIVAVGDPRATRHLRGPETRVVELAGATVFPGLHDAHAHPALAAREKFQPCAIPREVPWTDIAATLAACVEAAPAGQWIVTGPIDIALLDARTTRQALDTLAPDHPLILYAVGTHALVANAMAMKLARIDRSTRAPPGGTISRDRSGQPTGVLHDAWSLFAPFLPPPPDVAVVTPAVAWALDQVLARGVTSVTEASTEPVVLQSYAALADSGLLKLRVRACLTWAPPIAMDLVVAAARNARERLAPDCVKIFLDGETFTGRTAALLEPYQPATGSATQDRGETALPQPALSAAVTRFDREGLTVKFHAWGDGAVDAALTAIEAARGANGAMGQRHEIGHVMLARSADILRAGKANAVLEFSPPLWIPAEVAIAGKDIGSTRMARAWPVREALDAGTASVAGTDWPAPTSTYNPWQAIETLVTRLPAGEDEGDPAAPTQRITLDQAIALFTSYPALQSGDSDAPGIIAVGRRGDLVVLDRNPFEIPITAVHLTRAVTTFVDGEVVFDARSPSVTQK